RRPEAAEFLRRERAEGAERLHAGAHLVRVGVGVLGRRRVRAHLALDELADGGHDRWHHGGQIIQSKEACLSTTWCSRCKASSIASSDGCASGPPRRAAGGGCSSSRSTGSPGASWNRRCGRGACRSSLACCVRRTV